MTRQFPTKLAGVLLFALLGTSAATPSSHNEPEPGPTQADASVAREEALGDAQALLELLLSGSSTESVSPRTVIFRADYSLGLSSDLVIEGNLFKEGQALLHTDGGPVAGNTALGLDALVSVTLDMPNPGDGFVNTAVGRGALRSTTAGSFNSGLGTAALYSNSTGDYNTALGAQALFFNSTGSSNTATGRAALGNNTIGAGNTASGDLSLFSSTGSFNTASGYAALRNSSDGSNNTAAGTFALFDLDQGSNNIAVGFGAGSFLDDGDNNIYLGNTGETMESDTIRIGDSDTHTATFVAGVRGTNVANGLAVLVGSLGRLGTMTSSRRFKEEIEEMGEASTALLELRPVTFRYREDAVGDDPHPVDFGLIAEEVAEIYPDLVAYDEEGEPYSVRYHVLPAMLLNEIQRLHRRVSVQQRRIDELSALEVLGPCSHD